MENELSDEQKKIEREEQKIHKQRMKEETKMQNKTQCQISELNRTVQVHEERQGEMQSQIEELQRLPEIITVLFLASNPVDTPSLRLDAESRAIQEMIRKSDYRDTIRFETRWAVRTSDLLQAINEVNPDIIHFSGHGASNGDLAFENVSGQSKLVSKETMAQTIMTLSDKVRLIFFNACFSTIQAEHIVEHVDAAIGMNTSIGDEAALVFASQFYSSIGFGKNLKTAFDQAKAALMLEGIPEDTTPELFVRDDLQAENIILVQSQ
ncbi:CHAT domain-containing protein [Anaerovorax odorimutans]|nr:CHAT domain-containing protein [Anaerovorax odorimutans]